MPPVQLHMRDMSRPDAYVLLRLRAWILKFMHHECAEVERFHIIRCPMLEALRPDAASLYDDQEAGRWMAWWRQHDYLRMEIPHSAWYMDNIRMVGSNPFTGRVYIRDCDDVRAGDLVHDCSRCLSTSCDPQACRRPLTQLPKRHDLVFMWGIELRGNRVICLACSRPFGNIYEHLQQNANHVAL